MQTPQKCTAAQREVGHEPSAHALFVSWPTQIEPGKGQYQQQHSAGAHDLAAYVAVSLLSPHEPAVEFAHVAEECAAFLCLDRDSERLTSRIGFQRALRPTRL